MAGLERGLSYLHPIQLGGLPNKRLMPKAYGLAIDLGTTNICLSVWDLNQGKRLAARTGLNPQFHYGSDVMTRMTAAAESADIAAEHRPAAA